MPGAAAFGDLGVLRVGAAEHHKKSRMPRDRRPGGQRPGDRLRAAEDMRQKGQRGSEAVVARLVDKTARGGEKPPQSPARLVKMTGRRPALRAAHYRRGAVFASHAPQWEWCGTSLRFIGPSWIPQRSLALRMASLLKLLSAAHSRYSPAGLLWSPIGCCSSCRGRIPERLPV